MDHESANASASASASARSHRWLEELQVSEVLAAMTGLLAIVLVFCGA